jgi:hypothetical protein
MRNSDSPYLFDEVDDEQPEGPTEERPADVSRETVIVDGAAMSFRGYVRRRGGE